MVNQYRHRLRSFRRRNIFPACLLLVAGACSVSAFGAGPAGKQASGKKALGTDVPATQSNDASSRFSYLFMQTPAEASLGSGRSGVSVYGGIPEGSRIVAYDSSAPRSEVVNLTPDFAAAGRPDLSFDARRVLFVGKRSSDDPLSVWEMSVDGKDPRQVASLPRGCDDAIYLSTIYTIDASLPVHQIAFRGRNNNGDFPSLYTCRLDGSRVRRITFSPYRIFDPLLLSDGRLLINMEAASGTANNPAQRYSRGTALYTIHVDGTELFPFAGVHSASAIRGMPCETADGWVVFVESALGSDDRGGSLVAVSRKRSLHTRKLVIDGADGSYQWPAPLPDGNLLVSYRGRDSASYGLFVVDPHLGERSAHVFDDPQWHELDAVVITPRREPRGRSSVVDDRLDTAQLYCLNAYLSDRPKGKGIERGDIKHVRVIRALPRANGSDVITEDILGQASVENDGSFFLQLPAKTPLRLESLSEQGKVLQAMRSWIWLMPGERRGCIGCHEDRELTPPNEHVMALRKKPNKPTVSKHEGAPRYDRSSGGYGQ